MDTVRRERIRTDVATQRTAAQNLRDQIVDETVKRQLDAVVRELDDVDQVFLKDTRDRRPAEESRWLDFTETALRVAVEKLQNVKVQTS